jgi:arylsulfatase A-like enzyme
VTSPNLDRLAAEGARFSNCFVASPQCSPNRSAIVTGRTPHTTSTSRLHTPLPDWEPTFLEPLKSRGYFTGAYRKVHQGAAFDKRWDFYGAARQPFSTFFEKLPQGRPFFLHVGFTEPHRPYRRGVFTPPHDSARVRVPEFLPDLPEVREDLAMYYDFIPRDHRPAEAAQDAGTELSSPAHRRRLQRP